MADALPRDSAQSITDAVDAQLRDCRDEIVALEAVLAEQREHLEELEEQRAELARLERAQPLTGARVRDTVMALERFTMSELAAELDKPAAEVRRFLHPMVVGGRVAVAGKVGRSPLYEFVPPDMPGPREHPKRRPPELDPPSGTESRATGMPVRVSAAQKSTRRARSTPGQRSHIIATDRAWERLQEARRLRAEASKSKAQKDPKWKKRK